VLISARKRFVFVHIPKTAGTSITQALLPVAAGPTRRTLGRILHRIGGIRISPRPFPTHSTASEIIARIGPDAFRSLFSFAVVRNPWDLQVSLYRYIASTPKHTQHRLVTSFGSFEGYVRWRCSTATFPTDEADREETYRPQTTYAFSAAGDPLVDFLGRFERLDADFGDICSRLGITATLPRLNATEREGYRSYYDEETKRLVGQAFARDIELLGYGF
jgi:hypothetical protein